MTQNRRIAIIVFVIAALAIAAYFLWAPRTGEQHAIGNASSTAATSTAEADDESHPGTDSGYTVTPVQIPSTPDFAAPLKFSSNVSADMRATITEQFTQVQKSLQTNSQDFDAWILLGLLRKQAGDYAGAEIAWKYASSNWSENLVSNANLADLYTNYLHDYAKAASAYIKAIANDPARAQLYQDLYELYTGPYPQSVASIETMLKNAIAAAPGKYQLPLQLARYYVATHNSTAAQAQYDKAISDAQAQGSTEIAAQIQAEKAANQ